MTQMMNEVETHMKIDVRHPIDRDAIDIVLVRYQRPMNGRDDAWTGEYAILTKTGIEWLPFSGYDVYKRPFVSIDGLKLHRMHRSATDNDVDQLLTLVERFNDRGFFDLDLPDRSEIA
jgi:hypothetical protein